MPPSWRGLWLFCLVIVCILLCGEARHAKRKHARRHSTAVNLDLYEDLQKSRQLRSAFGSTFTKPDQCQPRDEATAQSRGRTCQRKCDSDSDCLNDRKLCLCDGVCGMSCIRPEKECPELPDPPHGQVHLTGRHFNDRAVYTCDDGYQIVGLDQVLCNSDGQWSGAQPTCKQASASSQSRYYCGEPTHIPNAKHNGSKEQLFYDLDTELTYSCLTGYKRKGFQEAQCFFYNDSARWFGPDLQCLPIDCGQPEDILNGERIGECTTYRCQIHYECVPGFELVGKDTRYCQSDGTWTPSELPACVPVQCPIPDSPVNGKAMFTAVAYKSVVSYECKYGFMIIGDATRTCGEDKRWTGDEPKCGEINCGSPGFLPNGWLEGGRTTLHAVVTFRCIEGMTFEGQSFRTTCQADGKWSHPLPKCYAPCIVPDIVMGSAVNLTVGATVKHGDNITVHCNGNYELASESQPIVCRNGTWSQIPKCEPARCKALPTPPLDGMVVVPTTRHGGVGLYQCKDGYVLKGRNTTTCHFGNWTGETPICDLIYCPFPGYIEKGKVLLVGNMGLYDYRPYVRKVKNNRQIVFECGRGFALEDGPPGATCIDGRWSPPDLPRCVDRYHPKMVQWKRKKRSLLEALPNLPKAAERIVSHRQPWISRAKTFRKRSAAEDTSVCSTPADEMLSLQIIKTVGGQGNELTNNSQTFPSGTTIKLSCVDGFELNSGRRRKVRCRRGEWRQTRKGKTHTIQPRCVPVKCWLPDAIDGGKFIENGIVLPSGGEIDNGRTVRLHCDDGYFRRGPEFLKCQHGQWMGSAEMPRCEGNPCRLHPIPGEGKYVAVDVGGDLLREGQLIPHGSKVDFDCPELKNSDGPLNCILGALVPEAPECFISETKAKRKSTPWLGAFEISASPQIILDGDLEGVAKKVNLAQPDNSVRLTKPKVSCLAPSNSDSALLFLGKSPKPLQFADESSVMYPHGTEIRFNCVPLMTDDTSEAVPVAEEPSIDSELDLDEDEISEDYVQTALMQSWSIMCEQGEWVGRYVGCDGEGNPLLNSLDSDDSKYDQPCEYVPPENREESNLVAFFGDRELIQSESFLPGSEVVFRCTDIGKFALEGSRRRRCVGGDWDGSQPFCVGMNQFHNYSIDKPPTILIRHQNGQIAQSNDGRLVVLPGTIVHMECLFQRREGTPTWFVNNYSQRTYPMEWTTDPGRNAQLEYRLSIFHAAINDSGSYTCTTPEGERHRLRVIVKPVKCPMIMGSEGLIISSPNNTEMNAEVIFSCNNGNEPIGERSIKCLPSGNWNHPAPTCVNIVCPKGIARNVPPELSVAITSYGIGGKASFECQEGLVMHGPAELECLRNGEWSVERPSCHTKQCPKPPMLENGQIKYGALANSEAGYDIGSIVQFECQQGYMMAGIPRLTCNEGAEWDLPMPRCIKACTYPGSAIGGKISMVKFFYPVGDVIEFECLSGRKLNGPKRLICLDNGNWNGMVPMCEEL